MPTSNKKHISAIPLEEAAVELAGKNYKELISAVSELHKIGIGSTEEKEIKIINKHEKDFHFAMDSFSDDCNVYTFDL